MDVLITGGSGAIGSFVSNELVERGHDVTIFDQRRPQHVAEFSFVRGDVTRKSELAAAIADVDAVIHMVSLLGTACEEDPVGALEVNVGGTVNVLEATRGTNKRVIYISSKAAFGSISGEYAHPMYYPLEPDAQKNPIELYGITKLAAEKYCMSYDRKHKMDISIFRFGTTYGPYKGTERHSISFIDQLVQQAIDGDQIRLSGGDQKEDFIYHADIASGLANALEADQLKYPSYHLSSGELSTLHDFGDVLREFCPDATIEIEGGLDFYGGKRSHYALMDISRSRSEFDFDPEYPIREGLKDSLERRGVL